MPVEPSRPSQQGPATELCGPKAMQLPWLWSRQAEWPLGTGVRCAPPLHSASIYRSIARRLRGSARPSRSNTRPASAGLAPSDLQVAFPQTSEVFRQAPYRSKLRWDLDLIHGRAARVVALPKGLNQPLKKGHKSAEPSPSGNLELIFRPLSPVVPAPVPKRSIAQSPIVLHSELPRRLTHPMEPDAR